VLAIGSMMNYKPMKNPFRHSIFLRLSLALFLLLLFVGIAYVGITSYAARNYYLETTQRLNARVAEHLIHEVPPFENGQVNEAALGTIMHSMMAVNPSIEVYLLDPSGKILSFVVLEKQVKLQAVNIAPIQHFLASKSDAYVLGDDPRNPGKEVIFSAASVVQNNKLQGYVYIVLQSKEYELITDSLIKSYFLRISSWGFLLTLTTAFLLGLGLIYFLTKGLRSIQAGVHAFENGQHDQRIPVEGTDELSQLALSINSMSDTILRNLEDLKAVDSLRRELIANVSHDLRSPMAVIHGYVETFMMKKDVLTEEEKTQYLDAIIQNSNKLNKLVGDLFELSKLEAQQMRLHKEPILINEMLHEMCGQFSILARKNNIEIHSAIPEKMPSIMVDSSLIGRAIQNILDNAIKFTESNGVIEVQTEIKGEKLHIAVSNTGTGISTTDIPHVFDRYYKANTNASAQSTGLGLAIAKKIIQLHSGEISVKSILGQRTTFSIEIPV
jgi:signal transduction histidine kinase